MLQSVKLKDESEASNQSPEASALQGSCKAVLA